jgi:hypothetical protein
MSPDAPSPDAPAPDTPSPEAPAAPEPEVTAPEADTAAPEVPPPDTEAPAAGVPAEPAPRARGTGALRPLAVVVIVGGAILLVAGVFTWFVVRDQLSDEQITVSEDADHFAGERVDGPFTAYAQADIINEHALAETDGLRYAQLDREDPRRETAVTASFLRASLFTSVVAFGVAAFASGLGILMILIGWALLRVDRSLRTLTI